MSGLANVHLISSLLNRVDDLLVRPGNLAVAREVVERYLDGRALGTIEPIPFPEDPAEPDYSDIEGDVVVSPVQRVAALVAFRDANCLGVERIIPVPTEFPTTAPDAEAMLRQCGQMLQWRATLDRVKNIGDYALPWFEAQLRRFELELAQADCPQKRETNALASPQAATPLPAAVPDKEEAVEHEYSVSLVGEIWHLRFGGESTQCARSGNQVLGWLPKLLTARNRLVTVADIRGDPDGRLAGDAKLLEQRETDTAGLRKIKDRLEDIDQLDPAGTNESLQEEKTDLLQRLGAACEAKQFSSNLRSDHHNIATQIRSFIKKLKDSMPLLAAHLQASLKLDYPNFGYFPPTGTPVWKI